MSGLFGLLSQQFSSLHTKEMCKQSHKNSLGMFPKVRKLSDKGNKLFKIHLLYIKHHRGKGITNSFLTKMLMIKGTKKERKTFSKITKFQ